jgi:hypothetical protein
MRAIYTFGFISGVATCVGFVPHIAALAFILSTGMDPKHANPLIMFTIGAKALGEWLFWGKFFVTRIDSEKSLKNWRSSTNNDFLLKQPSVIVALLNMLVDSAMDVLLVYMALKTPIPAAWIFLAFVSCQAIAAPIHGMASDYFGRRKSALFSMIMTLLAVMAAMEINGMIESGSYIHLFGLNHFAASTQMLIVLCAKSLFTGSTVNARAVIADDIQIEAARKLSKT